LATVDDRTAESWRGPIPWLYAKHIAEAFKMCLEGVDANKALGIEAGASGRPSISPEQKRLRDFGHCLCVLNLKATGRYSTWEEAKTAAARKLKVSKSAIDKSWKTGQRIAAELEFKRKRGKKSD